MLQVGVIGSYEDLAYSKETEKAAEEVGGLLAKNGCVLVCGGEKQGGLVRAAARGAKKNKGLVLGITIKKVDTAPEVDVRVSTYGMYGLREYLLPLACDCLIMLGGGSGTLNEVAVAYQNRIPVVTLKGTGGWADKLTGTYLDDRKKYVIETADTPRKVVELALKKCRKGSG